MGSIGSGTFQNFNASGGVTTLLPITATADNAELAMEFDQPYNSQQPVGSPNVVTSQVNFYILDASGNVVASSTSNNVALQAPFQDVVIPKAGNYFVAIQLASGSAPGHVEFVQPGDTDVTVSQQFGSAGGTYYPTTYGHSAAQATIGVGAVPWWASSTFLDQTPLANEPFSSQGPNLIAFNTDGSAQVVAGPGPEPDHLGARRRQHVVLPRAGQSEHHRHQQSAVPGPAGDADQPVAAELCPASSERRQPRPTSRRSWP